MGNVFYRFWVKALAFLLAVVCVFLLMATALFLSILYWEDWTLPERFTDSSLCRNAAENRIYLVRADYRGMGQNAATFWDDEKNSTNFRFRIVDENGKTVYGNADPSDFYVCSKDLTTLRQPVPVQLPQTDMGVSDSATEYETSETSETITIYGYVQEPLSARDEFFWLNILFSVVKSTSGYALFIGAGALLLFLLLLIYLARASCRTPEGELHPGWQEHIPFDLYLLVVGSIVAGTAALTFEAADGLSLGEFPFITLIFWAGLTLCTVLLLGTWMTLCGRVKLKTWWRHTIIFYVLRFLWKAFRVVFRVAMRFLRGIPLIWKTIVAAILFCLLMVIAYESTSAGAVLLIAAIASLVSCYASLQFRMLEKGGRSLATGNFETKLDTRWLLGSFRKHAETLNSLGDGLSAAVEKQLRSERMKTELITNVSHDIKTPLTSIINYADLLQREHTPEQETEYLEVLKRQSFRLKKLTEDLVEASKAASGSITVNRTACSMNELIQQVTGEFAERLRDASLSMVLDLPERELYCYLDGGLMWRMLDNLMTNIVKYAQPGTRVYLSLEQQERNALLTFKNVSRAALNIPAEELMERFVRGDASRNTEGNGLGLSITRSLCELQGGVMTLRIDGDLFKAALCFPLMENR